MSVAILKPFTDSVGTLVASGILEFIATFLFMYCIFLGSNVDSLYYKNLTPSYFDSGFAPIFTAIVFLLLTWIGSEINLASHGKFKAFNMTPLVTIPGMLGNVSVGRGITLLLAQAFATYVATKAVF